jgi:hypothetical protein
MMKWEEYLSPNKALDQPFYYRTHSIFGGTLHILFMYYPVFSVLLAVLSVFVLFFVNNAQMPTTTSKMKKPL